MYALNLLEFVILKSKRFIETVRAAASRSHCLAPISFLFLLLSSAAFRCASSSSLFCRRAITPPPSPIFCAFIFTTRAVILSLLPLFRQRSHNLKTEVKQKQSGLDDAATSLYVHDFDLPLRKSIQCQILLLQTTLPPF